MRIQEYVRYDGLGLADLVRKGEVSESELADVSFRAMDAVNGPLNAVIERLDPARVSGPCDADAKFRGVPFLLKDLGHNWAGVQCGMGSRIAEGFRYSEDGPLAARFRRSGLMPLGRTNTSEFGINGVTEPIAGGATRNPWDISRSPGGSSGGSAAAVAAGMVPLAHASDGGGSIRVPAAWCGLVGLKPSRGRNPLGSDGAGDGNNWVVCQHVVSRTVRDTAAALDVTSGPRPGDFIPLPKPERAFLDEVSHEPGRLRVAVCTRWKGAPAIDPDCVDAAVSTAALCADLGHHVVEAVPDIPFEEMVDVCFDLFLPGLIEGVEAVGRTTGLEPGDHTLEPQTLATLDRGRNLSALAFKARLAQLTEMSRIMGRFMIDFDVLITPAVSRVPCPIGRYSGSRYQPDDLSFWSEEMDCYAFSPLASITGQPAMTLPLHWTDGGLPVGVQVTGAIGDEAVILRLAGQLEAARPWIDRYPAVHAAAPHHVSI